MRKLNVIYIYMTIILLILSGPASHAAPNDAIVPGQVRADATFEHIGVLWWVEGDTDHDSTMTLTFRRVDESTWRSGAPAMRAYPTIIVDGAPLNLNYWAASAMFLQPGQTYELYLSLNDPDGGSATRTITATARIEPQADPAGRQLYVIPGNGGGDGSPGNPFKGLQAAATAAQPGDVFHVSAGTYSPFQLLTSGTAGHPIVFQGPGDGTAIVDGAGTDRGIVTLGEYNQTIGNVIVEGLTIQNGHWGVDAQNSHDIVIRRNVIQNVDDGVVNRRGNNFEYNQTIRDNVIQGRAPWPQTGGQIPSEEGIDLRGTGNVVAHNLVRYFGDCISVVPQTGASYSNDVFGNDVAYCVDDGIEIDYNQANARAWRNRVMNSRMGVSVQPMRGGPAYIFRNEFFNLESNPIKMHNDTTGYFVVHNTGAKNDNGQGDDGAMWRNAVFRNNLFLGTRYAFEFTTVPDEGFRDFDYDAWGTTRAVGSPSDPWFKWNNVRYSRLPNLQALGVEVHGVEALFGHVVSATLPAAWSVDITPGSRDLRLMTGVPEINAGATLPNLNDPFVTDGQPDMGAFEYSQPLPQYGPRATMLDLRPSTKRVSQAAPQTGAIITYTVIVRNSGAPSTQTVYLTDTLPSGVPLEAYSCVLATGGSGPVPPVPPPDLCNNNWVTWHGSFSSTSAITLTFRATVTETAIRLITNTVMIDTGPTGRLERDAVVIANGRAVYLPLVIRQ